MGVWGKLRLTLNSVTVYKTCFMRIIYYFLILIMIKKKKDPTKYCGRPEPEEIISVSQRGHLNRIYVLF